MLRPLFSNLSMITKNIYKRIFIKVSKKFTVQLNMF